MIFHELSQILEEATVFSSHNENILASIRDRFIPLEGKTHEDLEDLPRKIKKPWIMLDEEKQSEKEIKEHPSDPTYT